MDRGLASLGGSSFYDLGYPSIGPQVNRRLCQASAR